MTTFGLHWHARSLKKKIKNDRACHGGENQNRPKPPCPVVLGTHALQHSKLAFWRTCCRRAPSLKSSKTCEPEHQFFFWKTSPKSMFSTWFDKNVYDKNSLAWHRKFAFFETQASFPIFLASVSNQSQSVYDPFRCHWKWKFWPSACFHFLGKYWRYCSDIIKG